MSSVKSPLKSCAQQRSRSIRLLTFIYLSGVIIGLTGNLFLHSQNVSIARHLTNLKNKLFCHNFICENKKLNSGENSKTDDQKSDDKEPSLLLIGVLTTHDFLPTRALTAHNTWVPSIDGEVLFLSSEGSQAPLPTMTVVGLPGVDDIYPPMKKAFLALKYMYDNHLNKLVFS